MVVPAVRPVGTEGAVVSVTVPVWVVAETARGRGRHVAGGVLGADRERVRGRGRQAGHGVARRGGGAHQGGAAVDVVAGDGHVVGGRGPGQRDRRRRGGAGRQARRSRGRRRVGRAGRAAGDGRVGVGDEGLELGLEPLAGQRGVRRGAGQLVAQLGRHEGRVAHAVEPLALVVRDLGGRTVGLTRGLDPDERVEVRGRCSRTGVACGSSPMPAPSGLHQAPRWTRWSTLDSLT